MRRQSCLSAQRSSAAAWRTGSSRHSASASASNSAVKPEPSRAQGTPAWLVLAQRVQATRGTSACSQASNWKKSRCRHERRSRSWMRCSAAPQCGQASTLAEQCTSKSMRRRAVSSSTLATSHGGARPNALVNNPSTPALMQPSISSTQTQLRPVGMWTYGQAASRLAHMPTCPPAPTTNDHCDCWIPH